MSQTEPETVPGTVDQTTFTQAMMDCARNVPLGLVDHEGAAAGRRFSVYRNNVAVSLTEAMHSAFPVIAKLLGKENMDGLSGIFLRAHPPNSPLMMFYGAEFPAFLENMQQLSHLGYLGDVARLELALRHAYHAADVAPMDPMALAGLSEPALLDSRVVLAPALQLIRSPWPIGSIWQFNTNAGATKPQAGAETVLITRPDFDPIPQVLPPTDAICIEALIQGASIGDALEQARTTDTEFDLSSPLTLLLQGGAITGLESKG